MTRRGRLALIFCLIPAATFAQATASPSAAPKPFVFPAGSVVACVNLPKVASTSKTGAAAFAKLNELSKAKADEIAKKAKEVESLQQKVSQQSSVASEAAQAADAKALERARVELDRMRQDAQAELQEAQMKIEQDFQEKVFPIVEAIGIEKGIHFIFSATNAGFVWFQDAMDISDEVVRRLDSQPPSKK